MDLFEYYIKEQSGIDTDNVDFTNVNKCHDWRNYVPIAWVNSWSEFTGRERQIIAVMAQMQADEEEWE